MVTYTFSTTDSTAATDWQWAYWSNTSTNDCVWAKWTVTTSSITLTLDTTVGVNAYPINQKSQKKIDEEKRERAAAEKRAMRLLRSCLTLEQRRCLRKNRYFECQSQRGRRFRIRLGTHGNVREVDDKGREVASYCIQPYGVPDADAMLAQKLMIETDEESFERIANRSLIAPQAVPA